MAESQADAWAASPAAAPTPLSAVTGPDHHRVQDVLTSARPTDVGAAYVYSCAAFYHQPLLLRRVFRFAGEGGDLNLFLLEGWYRIVSDERFEEILLNATATNNTRVPSRSNASGGAPTPPPVTSLVNARGETPLMLAARARRPTLVRRLLAVPRVDVQATSVVGHTAFTTACAATIDASSGADREAGRECAMLLYRATPAPGPNPLQPLAGRTIFEWALRAGLADVVQPLLTVAGGREQEEEGQQQEDEQEKEDEEERLLEVVEALRDMLSVGDTAALDATVDTGLLPRLVALLDHRLAAVRNMACWCLVNVSAGTDAHTKAVMDAGAGEATVRLLQDHDMGVRGQAVWCLTNLTGQTVGQETSIALMLIQTAGVREALLELLSEETPLSELERVACLVRHLLACPASPLSFVEPLLAAMVNILHALGEGEEEEEEHDVRRFVFAALCHAARAKGLHKDILCQDWLLDYAVSILNDGEPERVVNVVLDFIAELAGGDEECTEAVVQSSAVASLVTILDRGTPGQKSQAAFALSNVMAGTPSQIQDVLDVNGVRRLVQVLEDGDTSDEAEAARNEATWALVNACAVGTPAQLAAVAQPATIRALVRRLAAMVERLGGAAVAAGRATAAAAAAVAGSVSASASEVEGDGEPEAAAGSASTPEQGSSPSPASASEREIQQKKKGLQKALQQATIIVECLEHMLRAEAGAGAGAEAGGSSASTTPAPAGSAGIDTAGRPPSPGYTALMTEAGVPGLLQRLIALFGRRPTSPGDDGEEEQGQDERCRKEAEVRDRAATVLRSYFGGDGSGSPGGGSDPSGGASARV